MIEFLNINVVQSRAFPDIVPAIGNPSRAFDLVPVTAWEVEYRGFVTVFHDEAEMQRYIDSKLTKEPQLACCYDTDYPRTAVLCINHVQVGYVPILHPFAEFPVINFTYL